MKDNLSILLENGLHYSKVAWIIQRSRKINENNLKLNWFASYLGKLYSQVYKISFRFDWFVALYHDLLGGFNWFLVQHHELQWVFDWSVATVHDILDYDWFVVRTLTFLQFWVRNFLIFDKIRSTNSSSTNWNLHFKVKDRKISKSPPINFVSVCSIGCLS